MNKIKNKFTSFRIISLGFIGVILLGTLLLMLPVSTQDRNGAGFMDALFTSTSAVCVTGLIVHDTATYWSQFGQAVLLVLIQIGGLGVITIAGALTMLSGRRIGLIQRSVMQESISAPKMEGIVKLTIFMIKGTFLVELVGALLMAPQFCKDLGFGKGLWYSIFHSISSFCNAGFDLMGIKGKFSSLTSYMTNPLINIVIMLLIIVGGIGFLTWEDIITNKFRIRKYRMQSKVILTVSGILILVPFIFYFFNDFADKPFKERLLVSLFQAVTPRTAGFNTVDLGTISGGGLALMMVLMLIGGSPGSTAGGMKTTTIAVFASSAISVFKRRKDTLFFKRSIPENTINNASAILFMYLTLFVAGAIAISTIEGIPIHDCLFETASAIGTVGLTLGITTKLGVISHLILIVLMILGRVGGLTIIYATISGAKSNVTKYPQEKITVG